MRYSPGRLRKAHHSWIFLFFLVFLLVTIVSAEPAAATETTAAQTTGDPSATDKATSAADTTSAASTTDSTTDTSRTTDSSESSAEPKTTSASMDQTTSTSSSETASTTSTSSDSTTSVPTTTTSTPSSTSTSAAAIVTVPPTDGAPYLQTSNTPEGTVFIAVGAILGLIGLAVLAWRGMVAWSVNRSVRNAALAQSAESKRLLRGSRKKRSGSSYSAAPTTDVSLDKLGTATRASYKSSRRVSANQSGLFYSPTAGGAAAAGSHHSLNVTTGNRNSNYMPAGFYAAASRSTPQEERPQSATYSGHGGFTSPQGYPPSPPLPPTGDYNDSHHHQRNSYVTSTSSVNLSQPSHGRAPSAYLEDLFENHAPSHDRDSGRR
ncbi:hypothetical protein N7468_002312 [Penicillium chermesinum]|uniref:Uncharacterized protein n=1 Tax=Penicillium chermesinum TaxID=63820 RepID=A0A9W9TZG3_9EURO|nr:uncharacterized protein N7468_002312 [Penicillium chermesinum]KAJ5247329.1 hypothetical protein N7468_002312 [Penicillium chermesinum]KAJ6145572.1 hypothetical protein N7470_009467 [Penicillium chermesinum]